MRKPRPDFVWQEATLTDQERKALIQKNAQKSFHVGLQAWAKGEHLKAWDWLERAYRLAPESGNVMFALALARQAAQDWPGAQKLLQNIVNKYDFQEGWILLCRLWLKGGYQAGAQHALSHLLSSFALTPDIQQLAEQYALKQNALWCGIEATGQLQWSGESKKSVPTLWYGKKEVPLQKKGKYWFCPDGWQQEDSLSICFGDGQPVLGSPVNGSRISACEGFVEQSQGVIRGWIWRPYQPASNPIIIFKTAQRHEICQVKTSQKNLIFCTERPHAGHRQFSIPLDKLPDGMVHVVGPDGRDLLGSPLPIRQKQKNNPEKKTFLANTKPTYNAREQIKNKAASSLPELVLKHPSAQPYVSGKKAPLAVIIPVYRHCALTLQCLKAVQKTLNDTCVKVVVVNDASPDPELVRTVRDYCKKNKFIFVSHKVNKGFPASVNTGLKRTVGHDVVLLNSDTIVPTGWLPALQQIAYSQNNVGTVTPLSNSGGILSYPSIKTENPMPCAQELTLLVEAVRIANKQQCVDIPTGNGFCLYIRHDCLQQTGLLREDIFAQGYGEENDFCMRAHALGWVHKAALGVYVAHAGAASFGQSRLALMQRNEAILEQLHPGYQSLVASWVAADPLWDARRRIDLVRFRALQTDCKKHTQTVLLLTHAYGGGVEYVVQQRVYFHTTQSVRSLILRPTLTGCLLQDPLYPDAFPSLTFKLPKELPLLKRVLQAEGLQHIEVHHLVGYMPCLYGFVHNAGCQYTVYIHDYALFCQRVSLIGSEGTYCGEPNLQGCVRCIATAGHHITENCAVPAYVTRSAKLLASAHAVYAPSQDTALRMARHFPGLHCHVQPLQNDKDLPTLSTIGHAQPRLPTTAGSGALVSPYHQGHPKRLRLCVIGAIGHEKGYDVLLQAAHDAALHDLPLEFVIVGHTPNDQVLLNTGRVFITGHYREKDARELIQSFECDAAFFPSLWPETWCLTLGLAWQAGLRALVFDHGAPAERVRQTRRGWVLNSKLRGAALNQVLIKTVLGCKNSNSGKNHNTLIKT